MKLREINSIELYNRPSLFSNFSNLPSNLLNWMENHLSVDFIVWDELDQIRYVTQSIKNLLDFDKEELIGVPWYERLLPLEPQRIKKYLEDETDKAVRTELLTKNNEIIQVELHVKQIRENTLNQNFVILAIKDITDEKKRETLTMQAEKMSTLGQLAASIVHEIRNPLTSIKGFLQLLQAGVNYKDEYYRIMEDEIEKIEAITSELLFMAKPSKHEMKVEKVDGLIKDVIILLESQAKLKNISIEFDETITDVIYCDRSQIKQVLINLIKNAIEAMDEPGTITLSTESNEKHTIVNVKDEGIGIPEDMIKQLEVAFFTTKEHGTGLGLSVTKEILKDHGGYLNIMKNETKGSTFQLFFPRVQDE